MTETIIARVTSLWAEPSVTYSFPVECALNASDDVVLDKVFCETNRVTGNEYISRAKLPVPSTSVGDLIELRAKTWIVDNWGFVEITPAQASAWKLLDHRDTSMGLDWVRKQGLIDLAAVQPPKQ